MRVALLRAHAELMIGYVDDVRMKAGTRRQADREYRLAFEQADKIERDELL